MPVQAVGNLPALPSLPACVRFSGLELLLDVGRACTRPEMVDDPETLFALFRYVTKISKYNGNMKLVNDVSNLDTHKKKVLSDEFGCGFSFLVSRRLLGTKLFLDTSTAIQEGWIRTTSSKSQRPDYVGWSSRNNPLVVLEAKGTQSRGYCQRQIARGCDQVSSVVLPHGLSSIRIAVGVELQRLDQQNTTTVLVGDPEGAEGHAFDFRDAHLETIVRGHYARVAALIGDAEMLDRLAEYPSEGEGKLREFESDHRMYIGSTLRFRHPDGSATLFVGIDREIRGQLLDSTQYASVLERVEFADDGSSEYGPQDRVRRADGTILAFWLEGPLSELSQ